MRSALTHLAMLAGAQNRAVEYYTRLKRVRKFVEDHLNEDISLERVADVACMEKTAFSHFFSNKAGVPFSRWLAAERINKAMSLLERQNFQITEVAHSVGFSDLRSFERAFKRVANLTPREFKKRVRPRLPISVSY